MFSAQPYISVVIPVFNEQDTLGPVVTSIAQTLASQGQSFELLAVEDGSQDASLQRLSELQTTIPQLRIARHLWNKGYGAALRTGIRCARGDIVVCMDADGQHTAADIPRLLALLPPYDMVIGYRTEQYRGGWQRNTANRLLNRFASWLTRFEIRDLTSGFRAMRRQAALHFLPLYPAGFSASLTATTAFLKAGYNITFIPIDAQPRAGGQSKVSFWKDGWRFLRLLLRMVMIYDPMRLFSPLSVFFALMGLTAMLAGILDEGRFFFSNAAILFYFSAVFVFLLGLIANQLVGSRIHYFGDESIEIIDPPGVERVSSP